MLRKGEDSQELSGEGQASPVHWFRASRFGFGFGLGASIDLVAFGDRVEGFRV